MKDETPEDIKRERDALLSIVKVAQEQAKRCDRVLEILIIAGHVSRDRVTRAFAYSMTPRPELTEERIKTLENRAKEFRGGILISSTVLALIGYYRENEALKKESEQVPKEPLCQHCGFPYGHHRLRGSIKYCLPSPSPTSWEPAP